MSKQLIALSKIRDSKGEWEEWFQVDSQETAEVQILETVSQYNRTLRNGERKRTFVSIVRYEEEEIKERYPAHNDIFDDDDYNDDYDW